MASGLIQIDLDSSELTAEIERLRKVCTPEQFEKTMYFIYRRTGNKVKQILGNDVPQDYEVKKSWVRAATGGARMTGGAGGGSGCVIPVRGPRLHIGGQHGYSASGSAHGWNSLRRKYRVKAKIVKGVTSTLPTHMSSYGGQPPFRNRGSSLNGITFTRSGKSRLPIEKVSGIAIPQMPLNKSLEPVQGDIMEFMIQRTQTEFMRLMAGGK